MYYCHHKTNNANLEDGKEQKKGDEFTISIEDTLELIYVRKGRDKLDEEIDAIFGGENDAQSEKTITFSEYL